MNIAVIGASNNPERISFKAVQRLKAAGHCVFPVNPALKDIQGLHVYASPEDIKEAVHTISLYINAERSSLMSQQILGLKPRRIIFNPGAENAALSSQAAELGIITEDACTLILLSTGQF